MRLLLVGVIVLGSVIHVVSLTGCGASPEARSRNGLAAPRPISTFESLSPADINRSLEPVEPARRLAPEASGESEYQPMPQATELPAEPPLPQFDRIEIYPCWVYTRLNSRIGRNIKIIRKPVRPRPTCVTRRCY